VVCRKGSGQKEKKKSPQQLHVNRKHQAKKEYPGEQSPSSVQVFKISNQDGETYAHRQKSQAKLGKKSKKRRTVRTKRREKVTQIVSKLPGDKRTAQMKGRKRPPPAYA